MKTNIIVQNLKCGGCAHTIKSRLEKIDGVHNVSITVEQSEVHLEFEPESLASKLEETLTQLGYPPVGAKNSLVTKAKSVVSCATGKLGSD